MDSQPLSHLSEAESKYSIPGNPPEGFKPPPKDVFGGGPYKYVHWTGNYIPDPTLAFTTGGFRFTLSSVLYKLTLSNDVSSALDSG